MVVGWAAPGPRPLLLLRLLLLLAELVVGRLPPRQPLPTPPCFDPCFWCEGMDKGCVRVIDPLGI